MVFESLLSPKSAEAKPFLVFVYGLLYASFALFLANYILPDYASLATVFFTTFFFMPLFYRTMIYEEKKDASDFTDEKSLLKEFFQPKQLLNSIIYLFAKLLI